MSRNVRLKVLAVCLLLVSGAGLVCGIVLERQLRGWLESRIESQLSGHARVSRDLLELAPALVSIEDADALADRMGSSTGARVTIVREDGTVLGDSSLSPADVRGIENHRERDEVQAALIAGLGIATRYSTSVRSHMHYVAVPFTRSDIRGVVRVAMPLAEVDAAVRRLRLTLSVAGVVSLVVAVSVSTLASRLVSSPLRDLVRSARAASAGLATTRLPVSSNDDLGHLAGSFKELVSELDGTVKKLAAERDRLGTILEGMTEALIALDPEGRVTQLNRAAMQLLCLTEAPLGHSLIELVRSPALDELMQRVRQQTGATVESELALSPGRQVLARAASVKSTGGVIVVMLDITEMRRLENVRRDFVANVSHELRTPVSVIAATAETLRDGALTHPTRGPEFLGAILRNAQRLGRLVSDLLDLSRIESGQLTLELQPTRVSAAVQRALEPMRELSARKRLIVDTDIETELHVMADTQALDQVLMNLIVNAVKYTPEGGHVEIKAQRNECSHSVGTPTIVIDVCDDGSGIEPRHRARIFERFYRVDPGRSREMGGTGLGLSIVKHLVGAMHGEVGVMDNPTGGSVFRVTLPAAC